MGEDSISEEERFSDSTIPQLSRIAADDYDTMVDIKRQINEFDEYLHDIAKDRVAMPVGWNNVLMKFKELEQALTIYMDNIK